MLLTFSHVYENRLPGTSVLFVDRFGTPHSYVRVKEGEGSINLLTDTNERWGDYTGIQRKYNEPGVCWVSGSYGNTSNQHPTVIAKIKSQDSQLSAGKPLEIADFILYPNPTQERIQLKLNISNTGTYAFAIYDNSGREVKQLRTQYISKGDFNVAFDLTQLAIGTYFLKVSDENGKSISQQFMVGR